MKVFTTVTLCLSILGLSQAAHKPRIICYWDNSQNGDSKLRPADIDATLCTHLHYAFFAIDDKHNTIADATGEDKPEVYKELLALKKKNKDLKVIPSVGGWGHPNDKFSHVANHPNVRKQWIDNAFQVVKKYNFDGLDLDWEYPVCWMSNCSAGPKSDHQNYGKFIKEIRAKFDEEAPHFTLSAAVVADQPGQHIADTAYDFKAIAEALDYVNVMTYDLAPVETNVTVHHSAFKLSVTNVEHYVKKGIPKHKVLMGVPFYGHSYRLTDKTKHGIGAPVKGLRDSILGWSEYKDICDMVKEQGFHKAHADHQNDPIAYKNDVWIGYEDPFTIHHKSKWVKDNGYGGIIIWEITQDDYNKKCCTVTNPLLRAINHGLFGTGHGPDTYGCEHK